MARSPPFQGGETGSTPVGGTNRKYTMPLVLNARKSGMVVDNSVYVGRPSEFGNPFKVGVDGNRVEVIEKYEQYVLANADLLALVKSKLRGKHLICWCAPDFCHADVLLKIANED